MICASHEFLLDFLGVQSDIWQQPKAKEAGTMILNTHPADRKEMVKAISELIGIPAV